MIRLVLIAGIVGCIAYLSPTREHADVVTQVSSAWGGVENLAILASSTIGSSGLGQRVIEEAIRRPRAASAEGHGDRLANPPERSYR